MGLSVTPDTAGGLHHDGTIPHDLSVLAQLRKINLNDVIFFVTYMRFRKIKIVSATLNCTESTASIVLSRFCSYFSEDVFTREFRALTPTAFALRLQVQCEAFIALCSDIYIPDLQAGSAER